MKKIYFLVMGFCFFNVVNAQIINFPDANFKYWLLLANTDNSIAKDINGSNIKIDSNNNNQIEIIEVLNVYTLDIGNKSINDLTGISFFKNLIDLNCQKNTITNLDVSSLNNLKVLNCVFSHVTNLNVSGLVNLEYLSVFANSLTSINLNNLISLKYLNCSSNNLSDFNLSGLIKLESIDISNNELTKLNLSELNSLKELDCRNNKLTSIDVNTLKNLNSLSCSFNELTALDVSNCHFLEHVVFNDNKLINVNLKNGVHKLSINFNNNPNLKYVCGDESEIEWLLLFSGGNCMVNSYCTFNPGGIFYTISGKTILDSNNNGCDSSDLSYSNLNFSITNGTQKGNLISNSSGDYTIPVGEGTHAITPILENPMYYSVSPSSVNIDFPTQSSPFTQDFCITPKGIHPDLEITLLPIIPARPGFDATYKIIYKNNGTNIQSGSVSLSFNDAVLDYITAIPAVNSQVTDKLNWNYSNLQPFETREIVVTLNVNSPMETPAVNIGDRLSFNALINPVNGDEKPVDNSSALRQSVVGSYDPNDKTCLEGDVITPDLIGEYVHYIIRFENTGSYPAKNIVVKDLIDLSKFDISSLVPTKASHNFTTKISDGNKVEFIFENINLPYDDASNDGYIAFKIKTLPTLAVGDSFENEANIYFDYNFPVLTNKAKSTFKTLGTSDFVFKDYFTVYPNPVNAVLNIDSKNSIEVQSISVYDVLGNMIIVVPNASTISKIDVSKLAIGNYFLKMKTDKGTSTEKFIKK